MPHDVARTCDRTFFDLGRPGARSLRFRLLVFYIAGGAPRGVLGITQISSLKWLRLQNRIVEQVLNGLSVAAEDPAHVASQKGFPSPDQQRVGARVAQRGGDEIVIRR